MINLPVALEKGWKKAEVVGAASCVDAHEYGGVGVDAFQFVDMEEDPRLTIDPGKPKIYCPVHDEAYQLDL